MKILRKRKENELIRDLSEITTKTTYLRGNIKSIFQYVPEEDVMSVKEYIEATMIYLADIDNIVFDTIKEI